MRKSGIWLAAFACLAVVVFLGYFVLGFSHRQDHVEMLREADRDYVKGETAKNIGAREEAFNQSLAIYTELEKEYHPIYGNGKLYFNIGNSYFQLAEYPFAVLYYYRAEGLMPREDVVKRNLATALAKLGIEAEGGNVWIRKAFFFHFLLSVPERLQGIFFCSLGAFLCFSVFIWTRWRVFRVAGNGFVFIGGIFLASLAYSYYLAPIEAVVVKASGLYRDAGFQYAKVQEEPLLSGIKVEVLDVVDQGEWLKVQAPGEDGGVGYVPQESVRVI